ncbi:serine hydrolase domain-containing protein [Streptomyces toxytricini]|uniref:Serine hydrolase domain-containing protein n=1 Tax=Streptomyces toxytricini TaxID=67369 RepID=A0ABW8EGN6_STRT5
MGGLRELLEPYVDRGELPGAVGLVSRDGRLEVEAVGSADAEGSAPMVRDSLFRIASLTKPVTAAAVLMLVEEGRLALDDLVAPWLPELASPVVVRTPSGPVREVAPADREITVFDLMTSRAGIGFSPAGTDLPAVRPLVTELGQGPPQPQQVPAPDAWMAALSRIPLLHQPGEAWLYNTSYDILGVLVARVSGTPLPAFLEERLFEPLGMADTGFSVPASDLGRFTSLYRQGGAGGLECVDAPHGQWSTGPAFPSGAGGLVSTADDWHAFARMLLAGGALDGGRGRLLQPESVQRMTTDWLTPDQRADAEPFLEGQGWGFGGSVDVRPRDPWHVPGRYGWVGGTGTAAHVTPSRGSAAILLTQVRLTGPTAPEVMRAFWTYAAGAGAG